MARLLEVAIFCLHLKIVCIFAFVLRDFSESRILFVDNLDEKLKSFKQRVAGSSPARLTLNCTRYLVKNDPVISAILNKDPVELAPGSHNIPAGLQRNIDRCIEKDPAERFQSIHDQQPSTCYLGRYRTVLGVPQYGAKIIRSFITFRRIRSLPLR
jgi:hypothetical protein